jgi:hypothetical protein
MLTATQGMPVRALPSAPPPAGMLAAAPQRSRGGFFENLFGLFGAR